MTVCQLYEKHIRNHANVRHGTKQGRQQLMRILEEDTIGAYSIENVKMSDAKEWALRMKEKGTSLAVVNALGAKDGFGFSAGAIDYLLNFGKSLEKLVVLCLHLKLFFQRLTIYLF